MRAYLLRNRTGIGGGNRNEEYIPDRVTGLKKTKAPEKGYIMLV